MTSFTAVSASATRESADDDVVRSERDDAVDDQQVVLEDERLKQTRPQYYGLTVRQGAPHEHNDYMDTYMSR